MIFGISGTELVVILFIGLLLVGPDKLPVYARKAGTLVRDLRKQWDGLHADSSHEIERTMEETGINDLKRDLNEITGRPHTV